jgi:hypothetical protein
MGIKENALRINGNISSTNRQKHVPPTDSVSANQKNTQIKPKPNRSNRNLRQIFILSFDALRDRKNEIHFDNLDGCCRWCFNGTSEQNNNTTN